ncbi:hypothetical protein EWM64_g1100 [Hericium alpestre]|uniref:tripeptidyl-peptidase II n=1 Tax=Hericium alpestre TaxID=135208 RepID=A0A4Z0A750_9AGAM|nr:hypothetical protein EWM64_g1100 [Hericium alpestre]
MAGVSAIPPEIIEQILLELDPQDISPFTQTCRTYHTLINHPPDQHFWRQLYLLQPFDDPRQCISPLGYKVAPESIDWKCDLQRIIRARTIASEPSKCRPHEREEVLRTLLHMASYIPPAPSVFSEAISQNLLWLAATLRGGGLLDQELWEPFKEEIQLRAKLHTYFGLTPRDAKRVRKVEAKGYVYDMRHYTYANEFGPFLPDEEGMESGIGDGGRLVVNWVHVQALHHDVSMHLVNLEEDAPFEYAIFPMSLPYCQSIITEGVDMATERDWAGVEGLWHCAICFIDHRALLLYNNYNEGEPLDPSLFNDPDFDEVFRIIPVNFRILSTEHDPKHPDRPKIHFVGEVRDDHTMLGRAEVTDDNHVRWHFVSGEEGQSVWSGECVQIGSVRSSFGILGTWTTVFHDQHDPVVPHILEAARAYMSGGTPLLPAFPLVPNNMDGLHQKLYDVSTPGNPAYGQHLSKEEVEAFVAPSAETASAVSDFLKANSLLYETISPAGEWLGINLPVQQANSLFGADFGTFEDQLTGERCIRTLSYSTPPSLENRIDFVYPTVGFPVHVKGGPKAVKSGGDLPLSGALSVLALGTASSDCSKRFTPSCAQQLYGIPTAPATQSLNRLAVSGFIDQYASHLDLSAFLHEFRPDIANSTFSVERIDGGQNIELMSGLEASLDIQYTVGIASEVPTTFITVGDMNRDGISGFLDLVNYLLKQNTLPHVLTTSYGFNEGDLPYSVANNLCNAYAQLGARGVSVLFSSGDGGVSGSQSQQCTNFVPTFPSGCPFVTSVGATQNVNPEMAADFSSGGFSNYFQTAPYQRNAVNSYLSQIGSEYQGRFNRRGRAFPDLSAAGVDFEIIVGGRPMLVDGTSCSSPLTASIISLLNDELAGRGRSPLGFLNPLIYSRPEAFTDITAGDNPGCNTSGFSATAGWDPVTGVGSPKYSQLRKAVGL